MASALKTLDISITQGKTFTYVVRWESEKINYAAISAITNAAPVAIMASAHGIPDGWRAAIVSVKGMTQINAANSPPKASDYYDVSAPTINSLTINTVNASGYSTYVSGGYAQYYEPVNITGYTGYMVIKDKVGGTAIASSAPSTTWGVTTAYRVGQIINPGASMTGKAGKVLQCVTAGTSGSVATLAVPDAGSTLADGTVVWAVAPLSLTVALETSLKTITLVMPAADSALLAGGKGVYELEMTSGAGVVTALLAGKVAIDYEVST